MPVLPTNLPRTTYNNYKHQTVSPMSPPPRHADSTIPMLARRQFLTSSANGLGAAALLFVWQVATLKIESAEDCLAKFKLNFWVGAVFFAGIVGARAMG